MDVNKLIGFEPRTDLPEIRPGDTVRVRIKVKGEDEKGKRKRVQTIEGIVLRIHRNGPGTTFTIRRVLGGVGVEWTLFLHSPLIESIEIIRRAKVRGARLYFLRGLSPKKVRAKLKPA